MSANPAPTGITPDTIVAIVAGAVVSITVATLAAASQWRDRKHRTDLAREDRAQERLKSAYEALLPTLHNYRAQVAAVEPPIEISPKADPPKLPDLDEVMRQFASAELFGSSALRTSLDQLGPDIMKLRFAIGDLDRARKWAESAAPFGSAGNEVKDASDRVAAAKQVVLDLLAEIEAQMRKDLRVERPSGGTPPPPMSPA
jgi:hypothetical protein